MFTKKTSSKVGIIGLGFVGGAIAQALRGKCEVGIFDKAKKDTSFKDVLDSDFVFLCLPTPSVNYTQDRSSLDSVIKALNDANYAGIVVIKSTVVPGTTKTYIKRFPGLRIINNPEFLSSKTALDDFKAQKFAILGGREEDCALLKSFYSFLKIDCQVVDPTQAEMTKYAHNVFLACKLSIMNELYDACNATGVPYAETIDLAASVTEWINKRHISVPGPDGKLGWGNKCFPKDVLAFLGFAKEKGFSVPVIKECYYTNLKRRPSALRE